MRLLRRIGCAILRFGRWLEPVLGAGQGRGHDNAFGARLFRQNDGDRRE